MYQTCHLAACRLWAEAVGGRCEQVLAWHFPGFTVTLLRFTVAFLRGFGRCVTYVHPWHETITVSQRCNKPTHSDCGEICCNETFGWIFYRLKLYQDLLHEFGGSFMIKSKMHNCKQKVIHWHWTPLCNCLCTQFTIPTTSEIKRGLSVTPQDGRETHTN